MMTINQGGLDILKFCEGYEPIAKPDPVGIPTIGWGTITYPNGVSVKNGDTCTPAQAKEWLDYELKDKAAAIENWSIKNNLKLTGNQFSALLCFVYNLGCGPVIIDGSSLHDALLAGNEQRIRNAFGLYVKATKKIGPFSYKVTLPGLVTRRKLETELFFTKELSV